MKKMKTIELPLTGGLLSPEFSTTVKLSVKFGMELMGNQCKMCVLQPLNGFVSCAF